MSAWAEPALRCLVPKGQAGHPLCRQHGGDPRPTCPSRLAPQTAPRRPPAVSKQSPRDPGPSLALLLHRPEASAGSMALFSSPWVEGGRLGQNEQRRGLGQGEPLRRRAAGCWRGCGAWPGYATSLGPGGAAAREGRGRAPGPGTPLLGHLWLLSAWPASLDLRHEPSTPLYKALPESGAEGSRGWGAGPRPRPEFSWRDPRAGRPSLPPPLVG